MKSFLTLLSFMSLTLTVPHANDGDELWSWITIGSPLPNSKDIRLFEQEKKIGNMRETMNLEWLSNILKEGKQSKRVKSLPASEKKEKTSKFREFIKYIKKAYEQKLEITRDKLIKEFNITEANLSYRFQKANKQGLLNEAELKWIAEHKVFQQREKKNKVEQIAEYIKDAGKNNKGVSTEDLSKHFKIKDKTLLDYLTKAKNERLLQEQDFQYLAKYKTYKPKEEKKKGEEPKAKNNVESINSFSSNYEKGFEFGLQNVEFNGGENQLLSPYLNQIFLDGDISLDTVNNGGENPSLANNYNGFGKEEDQDDVSDYEKMRAKISFSSSLQDWMVPEPRDIDAFKLDEPLQKKPRTMMSLPEEMSPSLQDFINWGEDGDASTSAFLHTPLTPARQLTQIFLDPINNFFDFPLTPNNH